MSDHSIKIDGLTPNQYKQLMSPTRDVVNSQGTLASRKVSLFAHGAHVFANFFVRVFYAVFVTHRWENDHNLMNHLWRDLNNDKAPKNNVQIGQINRVFDSLKRRLPANDMEKIRVEQKLLSLSNKVDDSSEASSTEESTEVDDVPIKTKPSTLDALADKLNKSVLRKAGRNDLREKILELLVERKLAKSDVERLLKKLKKSDDLGYINANIDIIKALGADHSLLDEGLNLVNLIYTLNTDDTDFRAEIRKMVLRSVVDEGQQKKVSPEQFAKIIDALTGAKDKEILQGILSEIVKKKNWTTRVIEKLPNLSVRLSGVHPCKADNEVLGRIYVINHSKKFPSVNTEQLKDEVLERISMLEKPEWKDELIALFDEAQLRRNLRLKTGLLKEGKDA